MPRITTANFDTQVATKPKKPVAHISIAGMTNDYCSGPFSGISGTDKKYLKNLTYSIPKFDFLRGVREPATMSFEILDKNQEFTADLYNNPASHQEVTIKIGFQELALADFMELPTQKLEINTELSEDFQSWRVVTRDLRKRLGKKIGTNFQRTQLNGALSNSTALSSITVDDTSDFADPASFPSQASVGGYIKINDEVLSYDAIGSGTTLTGSFFIGRGVGDGWNQYLDHDDESIVQQCLYFGDMYPTQALLHLLLTTEDGSGHVFYDLASYDSAFAGKGFNLAAADVDIEEIERIGYKHLGAELCQGLVLWKEEDGLRWITERILIPAGLIIYENDSGQISVRSLDRYDLIEDFTSVANLDENDIVVKSFRIDDENLLNDIKMHSNIYGLTGEAQRVVNTELDSSVSAYVRTTPSFEIKGGLDSYLTSFMSDTAYGKFITRRWHFTYGNPVGVINFILAGDGLNYMSLKPGDQITITNSKIPDTNDGTLGWSSKKFFITGQTIQPIASPPIWEYEAITFEAFTEIANFYNFTTIAEGDIDDTSITVDSSFTGDEPVDSNDAYWDNPTSSETCDVIIVTVEITPPNTGTTHHFLDFVVGVVEDPAGVNTQRLASTPNNIRYYSGDSAAFEVTFIGYVSENILSDNSPIPIDRVIVHCAGATASGGSGERPSSMTLKEIKYSNLQTTISAV